MPIIEIQWEATHLWFVSNQSVLVVTLLFRLYYASELFYKPWVDCKKGRENLVENLVENLDENLVENLAAYKKDFRNLARFFMEFNRNLVEV